MATVSLCCKSQVTSHLLGMVSACQHRHGSAPVPPQLVQPSCISTGHSSCNNTISSRTLDVSNIVVRTITQSITATATSITGTVSAPAAVSSKNTQHQQTVTSHSSNRDRQQTIKYHTGTAHASVATDNNSTSNISGHDGISSIISCNRRLNENALD